MLNAIEPGSVVATYELAAGGPACALSIPAGQWQTLRALDPDTVILEMKDGAYEPISPTDSRKGTVLYHCFGNIKGCHMASL